VIDDQGGVDVDAQPLPGRGVDAVRTVCGRSRQIGEHLPGAYAH
jgi:hypothetical protein